MHPDYTPIDRSPLIQFIPFADHNTIMFTDVDRYMGAIRDFIVTCSR